MRNFYCISKWLNKRNASRETYYAYLQVHIFICAFYQGSFAIKKQTLLTTWSSFTLVQPHFRSSFLTATSPFPSDWLFLQNKRWVNTVKAVWRCHILDICFLWHHNKQRLEKTMQLWIADRIGKMDIASWFSVIGQQSSLWSLNLSVLRSLSEFGRDEWAVDQTERKKVRDTAV